MEAFRKRSADSHVRVFQSFRQNTGHPESSHLRSGARRNSSEPAISGRLGQKLYGIPIYAWSKPSCSSFPSVPFFARFLGRGNKGGAHHQRLAPGRIIRTNRWLTAAT